MKAGFVNIPWSAKWGKCWRKTARRSAVFGVVESLTRKQRNTYARLSRKKGYDHYGLRNSPNPIFWRKKRFRFVSGKVRMLHGPDTGWRANRWPGFNAARYLTEVVLWDKKKEREIAVVNTHFVPRGPKVRSGWRKQVRKKSQETFRDRIRHHERAGRIVVGMGDFNTRGAFKITSAWRWLRRIGVDKIGVSGAGGKARRFRAPTDHKYGLVARVRY